MTPSGRPVTTREIKSRATTSPHAIAGYGVYLGLAALHRITRRRPFRLLLAYALTEMCPTS